jgi:hypothetical protein
MGKGNCFHGDWYNGKGVKLLVSRSRMVKIYPNYTMYIHVTMFRYIKLSLSFSVFVRLVNV